MCSEHWGASWWATVLEACPNKWTVWALAQAKPFSPRARAPGLSHLLPALSASLLLLGDCSQEAFLEKPQGAGFLCSRGADSLLCRHSWAPVSGGLSKGQQLGRSEIAHGMQPRRRQQSSQWAGRNPQGGLQRPEAPPSAAPLLASPLTSEASRPRGRHSFSPRECGRGAFGRPRARPSGPLGHQ